MTTAYTWEEIQEHRRQWIAALRSGEYVQGRSALKTTRFDGTVEHCCLGVAEELAGTEQLLLACPEPNCAAAHGTHFGPEGEKGILTAQGRAWLGVNTSDPKVTVEEGEVVRATELNDSHRWTFEQIADAFEQEWGLAEDDGTSGQDRESYTDTQDRENYTVTDE